jgi:Protein of unknown function (DUF1045)
MADGRARHLIARVAIYYAPAMTDPLWTAGCEWVGRDPLSSRRMVGPYDAFTESPRHYGFHATLKPPMRLAYPWRMFLDDAVAFASRVVPFDLPPLAVANLGGFLALRETAACPALHALADACVRDLDAHRVPPDASEIANRREACLSSEQDAMLLQWGYPHVLTTWQFHMTLTRRLTAAERATIQPDAEAHFATAIATPRKVEDICLFTQTTQDAPFMLAGRLPLRG